MEQQLVDRMLAFVRARLEADDLRGAIALIEALRPPDQADVFGDLQPKQQEALLPRLQAGDAADILEELEDEDAAELAGRLEMDALAPILDEMEPDEAADLLGDLHPEQARIALEGMAGADEVRPLLAHPDESAGGLMTPELVTLRRWMTAEEAIAHIRNLAPDSGTIYYVFVIDGEGRLCGVVSLRQLIVADPTTRIEEIMEPEVIRVHVGTDQEECARLMARYDLLALPVVDNGDHLVGFITVDDLVDVLEEETTEDIQRLGGAEPLDRPYLTTSVLTVAWKRIGWLLLLFVTETLTGTVLRHFQHELDTMVALAFFVPLLIGTGGNAGSQTTSTIIRALALRQVDFRDFLKIVWHEIRAGLLLGVIMAAIAFGRALTWGTGTTMALAVSLSIFAIVVWANGVGSVLPLLAARLRIDPTVVSGPFMSTLVDATGLFIYFTMAKLILGI
jgi:magnesium transporter